MKMKENVPQTPVFIEERVIDDRFTRFGKRVVERDYRMPNDTVFPILCITSPGMDPSIVFPVTKNKTVLLVNHFRFATNEWTLELPGGCPEPGQDWKTCAQMELLQEVGAEAETLQVIGKPLPVNPALQGVYFTAVLATGCTIVKSQSLGSTEIMTVKEIPIGEFRHMLKNGEITDTKTVAIGYLALDHLGLLG